MGIFIQTEEKTTVDITEHIVCIFCWDRTSKELGLRVDIGWV